MPGYVGKGYGKRKKGESREEEAARKVAGRLTSPKLIRTLPGRYYATRLKPESTAGEALFGLFMVSTIWNGLIAAAFIFGEIEPNSFPGIFLSLFGLFGALMAVIFLYQLFYFLLTGDPTFEIEDHPAKLGQPTKIQIEHRKRLNATKVKITLVGRKFDTTVPSDYYEGEEFKALFKEWRRQKDERKIFADSPFVFHSSEVYEGTPDSLDKINAFSLNTELTPPAELPPSNSEGPILIGYELQVLIEISGKPDISKLYPFQLSAD